MTSVILKSVVIFLILWLILWFVALFFAIKKMVKNHFSVGKIILWIYLIVITSGVIYPFIPFKKHEI